MGIAPYAPEHWLQHPWKQPAPPKADWLHKAIQKIARHHPGVLRGVAHGREQPADLGEEGDRKGWDHTTRRLPTHIEAWCKSNVQWSAFFVISSILEPQKCYLVFQISMCVCVS